MEKHRLTPRAKKTTENELQVDEQITNELQTPEPLKLEDMENVGPVRLKKLYANSIYTIDDILNRGEESLSKLLEISWDDARKMIQTANEALNTDTVFASMCVSGKEYFDHRTKKIKHITTGVKELDEITGGYETGVITEFFAGFGGGKTQFCMVASIMAQMPINACCLDCGNDLSVPPPEKPLKNYRSWLDDSIPKECTKCNSERVWQGGGLSEFGKPCRVIYIDTENSYRGERVFEIVCNRGLIKTIPQSKTDEKKQASKEPLNDEEYEKAMQFVYNIDISRPKTSALQMLVGSNLSAMIDGDLCKVCHIRKISKDGLPTHQDHPNVKKDMQVFKHDFEQDKPAKLVIVDSLTGKFRHEYEGRGTLSDRQMKLKSHVSLIENAVEGKNVVCLVTNQVGEKLDVMGQGADNIRPVGGQEIGHIFTVRIYLKKPQSITKDKITAILVDSPDRAKNEVPLELGGKGIQSITE